VTHHISSFSFTVTQLLIITQKDQGRDL